MRTNRQYDLNKLPKWAKREIEFLERSLLEAENSVNILTNKSPTRAWSSQLMGGERDYIDDLNTVSFKVEGDVIRVRLDGDKLYVASESNTLCASGLANNAMYVFTTSER